MTWSELHPGIRAAILALGLLVVAWLVWAVFVSPARGRASTAQSDLQTAEAQLEQMEREIESIPPAGESERQAWQTSEEEMLSRLGPESELPLLLESVTRLSESQEVEVFMTSEAAMPVGTQQQPQRDAPPSQAQRVLSGVPGTRYVPLNVRIYGDYEPSGRFVAQIGRLGWVMEIVSLEMRRSFPEVVTDLRVNVYFRSSDPDARGGAGNGTGPAAAVGALGGGR